MKSLAIYCRHLQTLPKGRSSYLLHVAMLCVQTSHTVYDNIVPLLYIRVQKKLNTVQHKFDIHTKCSNTHLLLHVGAIIPYLGPLYHLG